MYRCSACRKKFNTPMSINISGTAFRDKTEECCPFCRSKDIIKATEYKQITF